MKKKIQSYYDKIGASTLMILAYSYAGAQTFEGAEPLKYLIVAVIGLFAAIVCFKIAGDIISHASAASEGDPTAKKRIVNSFIMIIVVLSVATLISFLILKAREAGMGGYEDVIPER